MYNYIIINYILLKYRLILKPNNISKRPQRRLPLTRFRAYARIIQKISHLTHLQSATRRIKKIFFRRGAKVCRAGLCATLLPMEPTIQHRSFSSFSSWVRCGKAWQLERLLHAVGEPAWWFAGGSAFHLAAEKYLKTLVEGGANE